MSVMMMMAILLGVLAAILVVLMIYRSTLENHEEDQLFLSASESHMEQEQVELQRTLGKIEPMVKIVGAACGVVLLTMAGMWVYNGLMSTGTLR
jgi:multidrug efflux pump subunit AcrB